MKINLRESLNKIDLATDNKYDLLNTYDSSNISNDKKKKLAESLNNNASAKSIYNILTEDFEDDDFDSGFDRRYDVFSYYSNSVSLLDNFYGLEDDLHTDDFEEVKDWVWEKIQRGLYVTAADSKTGNTVSLNPNNYDSDWDDAYRVFDDLDELSPLHESLNEEDNFNSDEYERKHILRLAKSVEEASKRKGMNISNLKKTAKRYIENHKDTKNKKELDELIKAYKSLDEKEECLEEDTVKQNGKWVNKGSEGTHGKFKTKKATDAQRKAMFANGYKVESLNAQKYSSGNYFLTVDETGMGPHYSLYYQHPHSDYDGLLFIVDGYGYDNFKEKLLKFSAVYPNKDVQNLLKNINESKSVSTIGKALLPKKESLKEASYGGAYDIEDDMYFTKEDIVEFADNICEDLAKEFGYKYDIADVYMDSPTKLHIELIDNHDVEVDINVRIDMRRIKKPSDLEKIYHNSTLESFKNRFLEEYQYYEFDESLKESIDISDYEELRYPLRDGDKYYQLYRKIENGKGVWAAAELDKYGSDIVGEPFKITYEQARGFEPIEDSSIRKLSRDLGKKLLPKRENLKEDFDDEYESDFDDDGVEEGNVFVEGGVEYAWIQREAGPLYLDFDKWAVWSAREYVDPREFMTIHDNGKDYAFDGDTFKEKAMAAPIVYFVVEEDTGFIDWGPVESRIEAQDFLNGKQEDWDNDEYYGESLEKNLDEWYVHTLHYEDIGDGREYDYEVDHEEVLDYLSEIAIDEEDAPEDTEEYLKWVEDNFDELFNKYAYEIEEHFREDASQEEYDRRHSSYES